MGAVLPAAKNQGSFWQGDSKLEFTIISADAAASKGQTWLGSCLHQEIDHYFYETQRNNMYSKQIAVCSKNCDKSLLQ